MVHVKRHLTRVAIVGLKETAFLHIPTQRTDWSMSDSPTPPPAATALQPPLHIAFYFVPVTARRDGWTPARQRGFIDALCTIGQVTAAARHVGMTRKSAYRLRERKGAEGFAAAWDQAQDIGRCHVYDRAIERAVYGVTLPMFRRGVQTGTRHVFDNRMLLRIFLAQDPFRSTRFVGVEKANGS